MMVGEIEKLLIPILFTSNSIIFYVNNKEIFDIFAKMWSSKYSKCHTFW